MAPASLSQFDEHYRYIASKFHRNGPPFNIRICESIKSNLVAKYSIHIKRVPSPIPGGSVPLGLRYKWQPIKGTFNAQVRKESITRHITNTSQLSLSDLKDKKLNNFQESR
ncbi:hypothetical protein MTR_2g065440 [Medicago truncatula]|uniref:Uncharacterized protein n=1 Tax=Medicago truncatula TaxID=3880 RepID=G7IQS7_MEDTR|nr:hypothetical protein MTR_2g065440 [Medicago truncatula]